MTHAHDHSQFPRAEIACEENHATSASTAPRPKKRRGFAAMDPAKQREIASKGGRASHVKGTGHEWSGESARAAGRKGGLASHVTRGRGASAKS